MTIFMLYIDLLLLLSWSKNSYCRIFFFISGYLNITARHFICPLPQVKTSKLVCTGSKDTDQPGASTLSTVSAQEKHATLLLH